MVRLKNRKTKLELAKKSEKKPVQFLNNISWTDKAKVNKNNGEIRVWRREGATHDPKRIPLFWIIDLLHNPTALEL